MFEVFKDLVEMGQPMMEPSKGSVEVGRPNLENLKGVRARRRIVWFPAGVASSGC